MDVVLNNQTSRNLNPEPAGEYSEIPGRVDVGALVMRSPVETLVLLAEREPRTGAIARFQIVLNPDKLRGVDRPLDLV